MAGKLLSPEQEQEFMAQLQQEGGIPSDDGEGAPVPTEGMPPEGQPAEQPPEQPAGADTPAMPPEQAAPDPIAQAMTELGFADVGQLIDAFKATSASASQYKDTLAQLVAFQQAQQNDQDLDPSDPTYEVKKAIREEMAPLYERMQDEARNQLVQEAWGKSVVDMPDINDLMTDITGFLHEHPDLAVADDGLRRAYDGVRSKKYKSESQLLNDPEFIKRIANNEKVRDAVLGKHLGEIARTGDAIPQSIGDGGGSPLTGKKQAPNGMEHAKKGLLSMLGAKE